jgi:hypothetical protein
MSKPSVNTPTFVLKRINIFDIAAKYSNGSYCKITIPLSKIKIKDVDAIVAPQYSTNQSDAIYSIKDKIKPLIMATTNQSPYEVFSRTGGKREKGGICEWCFQPYTHEGIGVIIASKIEMFSIIEPGQKETKIKKCFIFWDEGLGFCSNECNCAWCYRYSSLPPNMRDPLTLNSINALKLLHQLQYPNAGPLVPAQDYRLIKENKGSIPYAEWKGNSHIYKRTTNVIVIPAKVSYLRIQND